MGLVYKSLEGPQELPAFEVSSGIRFIKAEFLNFSLEKVKNRPFCRAVRYSKAVKHSDKLQIIVVYIY